MPLAKSMGHPVRIKLTGNSDTHSASKGVAGGRRDRFMPFPRANVKYKQLLEFELSVAESISFSDNRHTTRTLYGLYLFINNLGLYWWKRMLEA